jgi:hypothetical protein
MHKKGNVMGFRNLAEAVILQSLEDLWYPVHRKESREFFEGEGFKIYAKIAEIDSLRKFKIIHLTGRRRNDRTSRTHRD